MHLPPNDDGLNDTFFPKGVGIEPDDNFLFEVYNRWGEKVFESSSLDYQWDGTINGSNDLGETAVYVWRISAVSLSGKPIEDTRQIGIVTLIR